MPLRQIDYYKSCVLWRNYAWGKSKILFRFKQLLQKPLPKMPLFIFLLDTSGSHVRNGGLLKSLNFLNQALPMGGYGLICFGNDQAFCACHTTYNQRHFRRFLENLNAGGGSPLQKGFDCTYSFLKTQAHRFLNYYLFILTDGCFTIVETNYSWMSDLLDETWVLDTQPHLGLAEDFAARINATYGFL